MQDLINITTSIHTSAATFVAFIRPVHQSHIPASTVTKLAAHSDSMDAPQDLLISVTDAIHRWFEKKLYIRDLEAIRYKTKETLPGLAQRIQQCFKENSVDVQIEEKSHRQQTCKFLIDPLNLEEKRIVLELESVSPISKVQENIQDVLFELVKGCERRGGKMTVNLEEVSLMEEVQKLKSQLELLKSSASNDYRIPSPPKSHSRHHATSAPVKRVVGSSLVNPHAKRKKAQGAQFDDDDV